MVLRVFRQGSVLSLGLAVLAATAVWDLILGFVNSIVMPFIANALDERGPFDLTFRLGDTDYPYNFILAQSISVLIAGGLIYLAFRRIEEETQECPYCLSVIPIDAFACAHARARFPS